MRAYVEKDVCIACGLCIGIEPEAYRMGDDGKAECYADTTEKNKDNVQQAADSCPVNAIIYES